MRKKIRVLGLVGLPDDGTSWYRAVGPLTALAQSYSKEVEFVWTNKDMGWSDFIGFDVLFIQRPDRGEALKLGVMAKDLGLKLWIEYDDNLLEVPRCNKAHKTYKDPKTKQTIGKLIAAADIVTVTTPHLASQYSLMNKNIVVVPNGIPQWLLDKRKAQGEKKMAKRIVWRGSQTHDADVNQYLPQMVQLAEEHPDWKWLFVGTPPYTVDDYMPRDRTLIMEAIQIPRYFLWLNELDAKIAVVPLREGDFNYSKSNIAWQEFTYAGAAVLAPGWQEWTLPGVATYSNKETFYNQLKGLITSEDSMLLSMNKISMLELRANWTQEKANEQRLSILKELVEKN